MATLDLDGPTIGLVTYGYDNTLNFDDWLEVYSSGKYYDPSRLLMKAILEDASDCAVKNLTQTSGQAMSRNQRERDEARRWIASNESEWIFSFVSVCEILRLNPSAIRKIIQGRYESCQPGP